MFTEEFISIHNKIKQKLKNNIKLSHSLSIYLDDNFFEILKLLKNYTIEGYLFNNDIYEDKYSITRDKLFENFDKYNKKKLKLNNYILDESFDFWKSLGTNSVDQVVLYVQYDINLLKRIFKLCSPPEILSINYQGINHMKNKFKSKDKNIIGIYIDTIDNILVVNSFFNIKLELYDLAIKYGNINNKYYLTDLELQGLIMGIPPLENLENAKMRLSNLK